MTLSGSPESHHHQQHQQLQHHPRHQQGPPANSFLSKSDGVVQMKHPLTRMGAFDQPTSITPQISITTDNNEHYPGEDASYSCMYVHM